MSLIQIFQFWVTQVDCDAQGEAKYDYDCDSVSLMMIIKVIISKRNLIFLSDKTFSQNLLFGKT